MTLAEALDDDRRRAKALNGIGYILGAEGKHAEAIRSGERALAIATRLENVGLVVWSTIEIGRACFACGDYRRGIEYARSAVAAFIGRSSQDRLGSTSGVLPSVYARTYLALGLARTGDVTEAIAQGEQAVEIADLAGSRHNAAWARYGLARAHHARADFAGAIALFEELVPICESGRYLIYLPRVLAGLGSAFAQSGRVAHALPALERALSLVRAIKLQYGHALIMVQLGDAYLRAGRLEEAGRHAVEALDLSRDRGERGDEAWAMLLHADVAATGGKVDEARHAYERALGIGEELGMRPHAAQCRVSLGALERAAGNREAARRAVAAAVIELRAMGIRTDLERAEQLQAELA